MIVKLKLSSKKIYGGTYENELIEARTKAIEEMEKAATMLGADAIIGVDFDYEVLGSDGSMLMVVVSGTAIKL